MVGRRMPIRSMVAAIRFSSRLGMIYRETMTPGILKVLAGEVARISLSFMRSSVAKGEGIMLHSFCRQVSVISSENRIRSFFYRIQPSVLSFCPGASGGMARIAHNQHLVPLIHWCFSIWSKSSSYSVCVSWTAGLESILLSFLIMALERSVGRGTLHDDNPLCLLFPIGSRRCWKHIDPGQNNDPFPFSGSPVRIASRTQLYAFKNLSLKSV